MVIERPLPGVQCRRVSGGPLIPVTVLGAVMESRGQTPGGPSGLPPVALGTAEAAEAGNSTSPTVVVVCEKSDPKSRDKDAVKELNGMRLADFSNARCMRASRDHSG